VLRTIPRGSEVWLNYETSHPSTVLRTPQEQTGGKKVSNETRTADPVWDWGRKGRLGKKPAAFKVDTGARQQEEGPAVYAVIE